MATMRREVFQEEIVAIQWGARFSRKRLLRYNEVRGFPGKDCCDTMRRGDFKEYIAVLQ
jgi:hypothetical protein